MHTHTQTHTRANSHTNTNCIAIAIVCHSMYVLLNIDRMNQKHLLRFIKHKLKTDGDQVCIIRDGKKLTLKQVFESLNLTPYDLNVDTLDMHADRTFHRFDKFNLKYNPVGESRLREIFLKYNNMLKGKYLAEITKQVFEDLELNKYQFAEYRVSIYGTSKDEWNALADWVVDNNLFHYNVRWMVQIPRLYRVYKASGRIQNFSQMIVNIFQPLVDVSVNPSSNRKLHRLLQQIVGFDMVDDESLRERPYNSNLPMPEQWVADYDPPYAMFAYYVYANLYTTNRLREQRGMTTFTFRPHAGEAGDIEHLAATFLTCHGINHGLQLMKSPALQYLYYLSQMPISMSPLSNNVLFVEYNKNPLPRYFARGLNVTLSTDDPLMIHVTKEPLVEEYSVASQVWKLTGIDVCEMARNSVLQSGWEHRYKAHFLGNCYWIRSVDGNDIRQTNVPDLRMQFRCELLEEEHKLVAMNAGDEKFDPTLIDPL
jgi:AMP deaminase